MIASVPFDFTVEPSDPDSDGDKFATLRGRASLHSVMNGGSNYEQLSVAQAVAVLIEQEAKMPEGISGWANDNWERLVTDDDPALPVPHLVQHMQTGDGSKVNPWAFGWHCSCGEDEPVVYAKRDYPQRLWERHVVTAGGPVVMPKEST